MHCRSLLSSLPKPYGLHAPMHFYRDLNSWASDDGSSSSKEQQQAAIACPVDWRAVAPSCEPCAFLTSPASRRVRKEKSMQPVLQAVAAGQGGIVPGLGTGGAPPQQDAAAADDGAADAKADRRGLHKQWQVESFVMVLRRLIASDPLRSWQVVDFACGTGGLLLPLACLFPNCTFTGVEMNPAALAILRQRAAAAGLTNVHTHVGMIEDYERFFHVGLALHACGNATDLALLRCQQHRAAYIVSPCCVGKLKFSLVGGSSFSAEPTRWRWNPRMRNRTAEDKQLAGEMLMAAAASGAQQQQQQQQHLDGVRDGHEGGAGNGHGEPAAVGPAERPRQQQQQQQQPTASVSSQQQPADGDSCPAAQPSPSGTGPAPGALPPVQHPRSRAFAALLPDPRQYKLMAQVADTVYTEGQKQRPEQPADDESSSPIAHAVALAAALADLAAASEPGSDEDVPDQADGLQGTTPIGSAAERPVVRHGGEGQRDQPDGEAAASNSSSSAAVSAAAAAADTARKAAHCALAKLHVELDRNEAAREANYAVLQEASSMERAKQMYAIPADLAPYLHEVAVWETKHIRRMAHLSALTYKPLRVNSESLQRRHKLDLVASSWASPPQMFEPRTAEEVLAEGDGMAIGVRDAGNIYNEARRDEQQQAGSGRDSSAGPASTSSSSSGSGLSRQAVIDAVASKLAEAGAAASAAAAAAASAAASPIAGAASAAGSIYATAAGSIYAGLASLPLPKGQRAAEAGSSGNSSSTGDSSSSNGNGRPTALPLAGQAILAVAASATSSGSATAQASPAPAAAASASAPAPAPPPPAAGVCPSEWFVCDDHVHHTRVFVIQGSDTIDHWRLNLTFDPVTFEDMGLGVTVHRGVYEAAQVLYDKFLPLVYEHLDSSPFARVTFTGHSIGGSMAVLLLLMYLRRGVLTPRTISTVYTFGAPSVFCEAREESEDEEEGAAQGQKQGAPSLSSRPPSSGPTTAASSSRAASALKAAPARGAPPGPSRLLSTLGLKDQAVRNVMMHRDIVPRAFACDYSLVADILKGWGPAFRDHCSLSLDGRKHLYYFVGRMIVLQPDRWHSFVNNDPDHPLLPPGPGLFYIAEPSDMLVLPRSASTQSSTGGSAGSSTGSSTGGANATSLPVSSAPPTPSTSAPAAPPVSPGKQPPVSSQATAPATTGKKPPRGSSPQAAALAALHGMRGDVPPSARAALMELMDCPHPLETLADPGAYLPTGSISRYHNPDHYTLAFGRIIYLRRKKELESAGRPMLLWPLEALKKNLRSSPRSSKGSMGSGDFDNGPSIWDSSDESLGPLSIPVDANPYS